jgi:hypothetical protein
MGGRAMRLLLDEFEALPGQEKQEFAVEILRRTREMPFDSGPFDDEEIGAAGRDLFALLDQEEDGPPAR